MRRLFAVLGKEFGVCKQNSHGINESLLVGIIIVGAGVHGQIAVHNAVNRYGFGWRDRFEYLATSGLFDHFLGENAFCDHQINNGIVDLSDIFQIENRFAVQFMDFCHIDRQSLCALNGFLRSQVRCIAV